MLRIISSPPRNCQTLLRHEVQLLVVFSFAIPLSLPGFFMSQYFFSYGSFEKGYVHYPKISQFIVSRKQAFLRAQVLRLNCGYPVVDMSRRESLVPGSLLELDVSENYWSILDALLGVDASRPEKGFFQRVTEDVLVENYSKLPCQVYCLGTGVAVDSFRPIPQGDWKKDMESLPPLSAKLSDRHQKYLFKLSKTKGRDVVPIPMDLYRELLSMELIVDKGRRVALTKLGKEVSLFLQ